MYAPLSFCFWLTNPWTRRITQSADESVVSVTPSSAYAFTTRNNRFSLSQTPECSLKVRNNVRLQPQMEAKGFDSQMKARNLIGPLSSLCHSFDVSGDLHTFFSSTTAPCPSNFLLSPTPETPSSPRSLSRPSTSTTESITRRTSTLPDPIRSYVNNLNGLLPETTKTLEELIMTETGGVFNNAAQIWNHTFYWNVCPSPSLHGVVPLWDCQPGAHRWARWGHQQEVGFLRELQDRVRQGRRLYVSRLRADRP